jgi:hypothetical protein
MRLKQGTEKVPVCVILIKPRFFAEFILRFFTSFRMTTEGLRMTGDERLGMSPKKLVHQPVKPSE